MKPQRYTATSNQLGCFQQHHLECISGCTEYSKLRYRLKYKISSSWVQIRSFTLNWELVITPPRLILGVNRVMSFPKDFFGLPLPGSVTLVTATYYDTKPGVQAWLSPVISLCAQPIDGWLIPTLNSQHSLSTHSGSRIHKSQFPLNIIFEPSRINTLTPLSLSVTQVISTLNAMDKNSESWQACEIRCWWHQLSFPDIWMVKNRPSKEEEEHDLWRDHQGEE